MKRVKTALVICAFAGILTFPTHAATTDPVGYVNIDVAAASSPSAPKYQAINLALASEVTLNSRVSTITSNSVTLADTVEFTINASNPYFIKFVSGAQAGRICLITSNSGSTLNLDTQNADLTGLSPAITTGASGDLVEIIPADTLDSVFTGISLGGASASVSDEIWIWSPSSGQYATYYYNTSNSRWQDTVFGLESNNTVIWPNSGVMYVRRGTTALSFSVTGRVPMDPTKLQIRESGFTFISGGYPIDSTLSSIGLHTNPSWVSNVSASDADQAWIWNPTSGQFATYFHDGSNWKDTVFGLNADGTVLEAGGMIMIKRASESGVNFASFNTNAPYGM